MQVQKAAGLVGDVEEEERDEVMETSLGTTMTIDITFMLIEAVITDDVAGVSAVIILVITVFPVSNFPCRTPTFIPVSNVGTYAISFILPHVAAVCDGAAVVTSFAADVRAVLRVVVVLWSQCEVEGK